MIGIECRHCQLDNIAIGPWEATLFDVRATAVTAGGSVSAVDAAAVAAARVRDRMDRGGILGEGGGVGGVGDKGGSGGENGSNGGSGSEVMNLNAGAARGGAAGTVTVVRHPSEAERVLHMLAAAARNAGRRGG